MKPRSLLTTVALLTSLVSASAQGPLTPPGAPGPSMRSLQELWEKMDALDARAASLELQNVSIQLQNTLLRQQVNLLSAALVPFAWNVFNVNSAGGITINDTSLAFGPDGNPAISSDDGFSVHYTRHDGTNWVFVPPVDNGNVGSYNSLKFGPDGQPAIAYYDQGQGRLKFARYDGAAWIITIVDTGLLGADVGKHCSLVFGPDGQPAIAYYDETNTDLRFARFDGSNWIRTPVDDGGAAGAGEYCSLTFGPDSQPAISYRHSSDGLKFAQFNGTSWVLSVVHTAGTGGARPEGGYHSSLAFGPDGRVAISHFDNDGGTLRLIRFNSNSWSSSIVEEGNGGDGYSSLAYGPDGQPNIAYSGGPNIYLKFAHLNPNTGGINAESWDIIVVDEPGATGLHNSLAFGPDGQPAISYYSAVHTRLEFARKGAFRIGQ